MGVELLLLSKASVRSVADTSAIINLNATKYAAEILGALPGKLVVVDIVVSELEQGRAKGRQDADKLGALAASGHIEIVKLSDSSEEIFEELVTGPAESTLDDGEAATIAYAVEHSLGVVIDDGKARRLCRDRYKAVPLQCSIDILQHPAIDQMLGRDRLSAAILSALQTARMRVLREHIDWVKNLIGEANAESCSSLPRRK